MSAARDEKALELAREALAGTVHDESQRLAKVQLAILTGMAWSATGPIRIGLVRIGHSTTINPIYVASMEYESRSYANCAGPLFLVVRMIDGRTHRIEDTRHYLGGVDVTKIEQQINQALDDIAADNPQQGYVDAFYRIAGELGIPGPQFLSPAVVFESQMLPKLREMMQARNSDAGSVSE